MGLGNILYTSKIQISLNPKTGNGSSDKKLETSRDIYLILSETGLDLTLKKRFLICETLLYKVVNAKEQFFFV